MNILKKIGFMQNITSFFWPEHAHKAWKAFIDPDWHLCCFIVVRCYRCVCLHPADGGAGAVCDSDGHAHRCGANILVLQRETGP